MSGPYCYDNVKVATTTTGTGTLTLGAAVTGHQAVPAAMDGKVGWWSVYAVDVDGNRTGEWETFVGTYTHAGTTLTRGTFKASSTGSAVSFAAGTKHVHLGPLSASFQSTNTGTDAAVTLVANEALELEGSILSADRNLTLPTTAAIGDICEVGLLSGNSSFEAILLTGAGETCELRGAQIAAASEITRLRITSEWMRFKKVSATKWRAYDGRVPMKGHLRLSTASTGNTADTFVYPTAFSGVWTEDLDIGGIADPATEKFTPFRACKAHLAGVGRANSALGDTKYVNLAMELNGTTLIVAPALYASGATQPFAPPVVLQHYPFAVGDYMRFKYRTEEASKGLASGTVTYAGTTYFSFTEVF